jgi:hypothetical protein
MTDTTRLKPGEDNVLSALDAQPATAFYWQLTLLSAIGGFLFGYDTSNGFVFWFLPETKERPVEEIIRLFERGEAAGAG